MVDQKFILKDPVTTGLSETVTSLFFSADSEDTEHQLTQEFTMTVEAEKIHHPSLIEVRGFSTSSTVHIWSQKI